VNRLSSLLEERHPVLALGNQNGAALQIAEDLLPCPFQRFIIDDIDP
jgi:hypothetical protein